MSKKPVPSKKQCPSSTKSRKSKFMYTERTRLEKANVFEKCSSCGAIHRRHEMCKECGKYNGMIIQSKPTSKLPIREIKA